MTREELLEFVAEVQQGRGSGGVVKLSKKPSKGTLCLTHRYAGLSNREIESKNKSVLMYAFTF